MSSTCLLAAQVKVYIWIAEIVNIVLLLAASVYRCLCVTNACFSLFEHFFQDFKPRRNYIQPLDPGLDDDFTQKVSLFPQVHLCVFI